MSAALRAAIGQPGGGAGTSKSKLNNKVSPQSPDASSGGANATNSPGGLLSTATPSPEVARGSSKAKSGVGSGSESRLGGKGGSSKSVVVRDAVGGTITTTSAEESSPGPVPRGLVPESAKGATTKGATPGSTTVDSKSATGVDGTVRVNDASVREALDKFKTEGDVKREARDRAKEKEREELRAGGVVAKDRGRRGSAGSIGSAADGAARGKEEDDAAEKAERRNYKEELREARRQLKDQEKQFREVVRRFTPPPVIFKVFGLWGGIFDWFWAVLSLVVDS